ncbi:MAG: DNA-processing protein DprA [Balneolales bacterium]
MPPHHDRMTEDQRVIMALSLVPQLGAQRIRSLLRAVETPSDIFKLNSKELLAIHGIGKQVAAAVAGFKDWEKVDRIVAVTEKLNALIITPGSQYYPVQLREIYDSPLLLWVLGDPEALGGDNIAVVGTRTPTAYGISMAELFVEGLAAHQVTIISGLAYGIDTIAHKKALDCRAKTVAVLGSGIDRIYPNANIPLAHRILKNGGAVISEFPPGTNPDAGNFPMRNRIVSGLSLGVLVIETGLTGGSMITANSALDQNREVFIVPHANDSKLGHGCNKLIKEGYGKLVQHIGDLSDEITFRHIPAGPAADNPSPGRWRDKKLRKELGPICALLEDGPLHIDMIAARLDRNGSQLLADLLELEFIGCIRQKAGKIFQL